VGVRAENQWGIPGIGQYDSFFDTEGNRVSMLQLSDM
jgi:hypothetical protein